MFFCLPSNVTRAHRIPAKVTHPRKPESGFRGIVPFPTIIDRREVHSFWPLKPHRPCALLRLRRHPHKARSQLLPARQQAIGPRAAGLLRMQ